jgi:uncharacterized protein (DUF3084 family)
MEKHRPMVSCLALAHPVAVKEQERLASNLEYVFAKTEYWDKRIVEELSAKIIEIGKFNLALKNKARDAEGETSIVKAVGINSPEMKALQAKVNELEGTLGSAQDTNENHQRYNGKLQTRLTEVEEDNKRLSKQIQDLTTSRKFGDGTH